MNLLTCFVAKAGSLIRSPDLYEKIALPSNSRYAQVGEEVFANVQCLATEMVSLVGAGACSEYDLPRGFAGTCMRSPGQPRNAPAHGMHGFVSRDGTPPAELLAAGRVEVERYGGRVVAGEVRSVRRGSAAAGFGPGGRVPDRSPP